MSGPSRSALSVGSSGGPGVYLSTHFRSDDESLYYAVSADGIRFKTLGRAAYTPTTATVRDPSSLLYNNKLYMAHTAGTGNTFPIAVSADISTPGALQALTPLAVVTEPTAGVQVTWAPQFTVDTDGSVYVFASRTLDAGLASNSFVTVAWKANDATLTSWSYLGVISIANAGTQASTIDFSNVVKIGSTYHAMVKSQASFAGLSGARNYHITASAITGPWTVSASQPPSASGVEAPQIMVIPTGWRIFQNTTGTTDFMTYVDTADFVTFSASWSPVQNPDRMTHGDFTSYTANATMGARIAELIIGAQFPPPDLLAIGAGSTEAVPRKIGSDANQWVAGNALQIGISLTESVQFGFARKTQWVSFNGVDIIASRQTTTTRAFVNGASTDPSLRVIGTVAANAVLRAKGATSQSGNLVEGTNSSDVVLGAMAANGALRPGNGAGTVVSGASVYSGSGAPTIAGVLGDVFFRTDTPSTANQRIYVCTTAGAAGVAVWTGIA